MGNPMNQIILNSSKLCKSVVDALFLELPSRAYRSHRFIAMRDAHTTYTPRIGLLELQTAAQIRVSLANAPGGVTRRRNYSFGDEA